MSARVVEGKYCDIPREGFVKNGNGFFGLFYHLFSVPPAIVISSTTIFDDFGGIHLFLFLDAMKPPLRSAKKFIPLPLDLGFSQPSSSYDICYHLR
jgi:hypothetical protein